MFASPALTATPSSRAGTPRLSPPGPLLRGAQGLARARGYGSNASVSSAHSSQSFLSRVSDC